MTAIAGIVGEPPTGSREAACEASLAALTLYGSRKSTAATGMAAFGANLRMILPEDRFDRQPYRNERFLLVADVRLDNREELLAALGEQAPNSTQCADGEIVFRAWCKWQFASIDRIVGDYAIAVHDSHANDLCLARDPIGQRPLFYGRIGDAWGFASMPSGLLALGHRDYDNVRIVERLAARENASRRSYFQGIERVLSGEMVRLSARRSSVSRWAPRTDPFVGRSDDDLLDAMRETFDTAVRSRLRRAAGPVATQLSSGYDSSAVTATASRLSEADRIVAFTSAPARELATVSIRGRIADESHIAARTAQFLGIEHEVVRAGTPLLDSLRGHARYFQEPVRNVLNMDWWAEIDRRAADHGATILLIGDAGNLTVNAGGLNALADWLKDRRWKRWWTEARHAARRPDVRWRGVLWSSARLALPRRVNEQLVQLFLGQPRWSSACFVRPEILARLEDEQLARPRTQAEERLDLLRGFDAGAFRKGALARYGIDERDPTADRRLIELTLRLPPEQLLRRGVYRPLARALWSTRLPEAVLDAPLRGYQGSDWISRLDRNDALAALEEISPNAAVQEVIDLPRLKQAIDGWADPRERGSGEIEAFGRHVTNALAMGVFLVEGEDRPQLGV